MGLESNLLVLRQDIHCFPPTLVHLEHSCSILPSRPFRYGERGPFLLIIDQHSRIRRPSQSGFDPSLTETSRSRAFDAASEDVLCNNRNAGCWFNLTLAAWQGRPLHVGLDNQDKFTDPRRVLRAL